jgi:uncharacterized protein (DUF305 family)
MDMSSMTMMDMMHTMMENGMAGDGDMSGMEMSMGDMMYMMHMMHMMNMQDMMGNMEGMDMSGMSMMDMMHTMMNSDMMDTNGMMGGMGGMNNHNDHANGEHEGAEGEHHYDPAMTMGMMSSLNRLTGVEYEVAWLEAMIDHHDDALHMSERLLERTPNGHAELHTFAQGIIDAQTAEITTMEAMITELQGTPE